jgi:hypothetical protein
LSRLGRIDRRPSDPSIGFTRGINVGAGAGSITVRRIQNSTNR